MKPYLLGIDIGTSACKVAIFEKSGNVVAAVNGDYPVYYPKEGWAEQNPEEWWSAVCSAVKKLSGKQVLYRMRSQASVLTDRAGQRLPWIKMAMF